jgi:hypothetical protein
VLRERLLSCFPPRNPDDFTNIGYMAYPWSAFTSYKNKNILRMNQKLEWLNENCSDWWVEWENGPNPCDGVESTNYYVVFTNPSDHVIYKLTWA